jgi:hypothetical protein
MSRVPVNYIKDNFTKVSDEMITLCQKNDSIIDRESAPFVAIMDFLERRKGNPDQAMKNSEWYIGRKTSDFVKFSIDRKGE